MDRPTPRPVRTHRLLALTLALGLAIPLVACGTDGELRTGDGPTTTTEPGGSTTSPPDPDPRPIELPADQIVWQDSSGGGMSPPSPLASQLASLTIYGDGRAFRLVADDDRQYLDPIAVELGTVSPEDLTALVTAAEGSGLFSSGDTDFGDPMVTDLGSRSVRFQGSGGPVEVSAYAFDEQFEDDLSDAEQARRRDLRDLLARAEDAVADAEPWVPDRIAVADLDDSRYGSTSGSPRPWPGPAFDTFLDPTEQFGASVCGELTGDEAATVWAAALEEHGSTWVAGDDRRELAVAAVLPGEDPCADA